MDLINNWPERLSAICELQALSVYGICPVQQHAILTRQIKKNLALVFLTLSANFMDTDRVSTEFRRHGIPRNFLTSEVISAQFRRNCTGNHFRIPRNAKMSLPWTP